MDDDKKDIILKLIQEISNLYEIHKILKERVLKIENNIDAIMEILWKM